MLVLSACRKIYGVELRALVPGRARHVIKATKLPHQDIRAFFPAVDVERQFLLGDVSAKLTRLEIDQAMTAALDGAE
jgi:hypothetical protein